MKPYVSEFFSLLSAFVRQQPPSVDENTDWDSLLQLAENHEVKEIVAYMAEQLPKQQQPAAMPAVSAYWKMRAAHAIQKQVGFMRVSQQLTAHDIPHVFFKGSILRELYPVPELRSFGDVDILIHAEDLSAVQRLMAEAGYREESPAQPVYPFSCPGEHYEFHTRLLIDRDVFAQYVGAPLHRFIDDAWEHTITRPDGLTTMDSVYHLTYLLLHLVKHFSDYGAGVRMLLDITLLVLHTPSLDWTAFWQPIEQIGLRPFAENIFRLINRWFALPLPPTVTGQLSEPLYEELASFFLSGGTFGFTERSTAVADLRNAYDPAADRGDGSRWRALRRQLFPPYAYMRLAYPMVDGRPYLLPIGWVQRAWHVATHDRRYAGDRLTHILSEQELAQAKRHYELYTQIGLLPQPTISERRR